MSVSRPYIEVERNLRLIGEKYTIKSIPRLKGYHPFGGKNFMTDSVVYIGELSNASGLYIELSYGRGIFGGYLYGVTFATKDKTQDDFCHEISGACSDYKEIKEKIESAIKEYNNLLA